MDRFRAAYDRPLPAVLRKGRVDAARMCSQAVLTFPLHDLAGDYVEPAGLDFRLHKADPSIDLEHGRDPGVRGLPVAWARESLGAPGAPYAVEYKALNIADDGQPPQIHELPIGTSYFDKSCRVSTQVFALVEQDALPAVSLEFKPVHGFFKSLGRSPLEPRDAYHFDRADVIRWTVCAKGVNPGALSILKGVAQQVPALERILRDRRVNVGGTWEPLHERIYKALAATGGASAVLKAREPYSGAYPGDKCPECGEPPKGACRCVRNDRFCGNGHTWERLEDGMPALLDGGHGKVIKAYGGDTIQQAELKRRKWPRTTEKAMEPEYEAGATGGGDAALQTGNEAAVEEMGVDEDGPTPTAQAAYDLAQGARDLCDQIKAAAMKGEHKPGRKKLAALCEKLDAISEMAMGVGKQVDADLSDDGEVDGSATEDEDGEAAEGEESKTEGDDGEVDDDEEEEPFEKALVTVTAADMRTDASGVLNGIPKTFKKAVKRFTLRDLNPVQPAEVKKAEAARPEDAQRIATLEASLEKLTKKLGFL